MEIYTIKASIKQAFRQNYTEERRVGDYAAAKYLYSCLLARLAVECYAQRRQLPLHDADFHNGLLTHVRGGQPGQAYAAIVQSLDTLPMWRETTTQDLVAQLKGRLALLGVSPSLRKWFIRYANSVKLWLARTVTTYRDRLQGTLARLEEALAGVGSPAFFEQELAGVHAILNMVNPEILACLPSLFWATHMGENDGLPVSQAAPRILSCVWAIADGVETLSGLISHFNGEYSMSLRQPRLVPIVPMAPVRPGFMAYGDTMGLLNDNFCHRVGINHALPHATNPLTEEQKRRYRDNPRSMGRLREFGWRRHHPIPTPIRLKAFYGSSGFTTPAGMFIPCAPYRKFAREIVPLLKRYNIVVDLNMVNEDRTTVVCPHCHAPYKRVRPRDDQHVHPHRVMLCENPQCRGAQWRATVPDALNVDHRDKSAAENILWRSLATEDELSGSPFSRTSIPRLPTSFQYHQLANRHHSSADG
ncbi:hypothetical protein J8273_2156 [Carpediemonas membranifera]|uniref:Uncharacterized protein n=1 Tax=Carpediemonas membranifera TaxID=201153 RepID=A0A8J6B026_9EUKA|nr:hypothetical protein J8273_2156 [Carpediemonas membranifera]|eukprot:KAG9396425.1 hypothetical protein J8273_2156 [Carpediemonas membranifera]